MVSRPAVAPDGLGLVTTLDVTVTPVMVGGREVGAAFVVGDRCGVVRHWPNMAPHYSATWQHDGTGGACAVVDDVSLSVVPTDGAYSCCLVGRWRGRHYDVRFPAATLAEAGAGFREVLR